MRKSNCLGKGQRRPFPFQAFSSSKRSHSIGVGFCVGGEESRTPHAAVYLQISTRRDLGRLLKVFVATRFARGRGGVGCFLRSFCLRYRSSSFAIALLVATESGGDRQCSLFETTKPIMSYGHLSAVDDFSRPYPTICEPRPSNIGRTGSSLQRDKLLSFLRHHDSYAMPGQLWNQATVPLLSSTGRGGRLPRRVFLAL